VIHKEFGYWNGDPASILPLLPVEHAKRHVDLIGRDTIIAEGRRAIDSGDYRWAVQILHHLVWADADDAEAKDLQADAYEQLGYQQEVPQYRAIFLTAAQELREGVRRGQGVSTANLDTIIAMPIGLLFDFVAVHVIGERAADVDVRINCTFTDSDSDWTMWVRHGVLNAREGHVDDVQLTLRGPKPAIAQLLLQPGDAADPIASGAVATDGDTSALETLAALMDAFDTRFNLATP
jgi:linear primary-alkylsulfatase